ncbi:unnamed protein product [Protopolystoma xenopodis]|uniref:Uncharacterized protein n=1 Tax=Protopolystoma xenopodis TaxID=117903 RepID=A0A3S5ARW0_9PLAT|nr:unnamed protein product [Protopolystoma xenopodis]
MQPDVRLFGFIVPRPSRQLFFSAVCIGSDAGHVVNRLILTDLSGGWYLRRFVIYSAKPSGVGTLAGRRVCLKGRDLPRRSARRDDDVADCLAFFARLSLHSAANRQRGTKSPAIHVKLNQSRSGCNASITNSLCLIQTVVHSFILTHCSFTYS